jgi:hypothetical protein
MYNMSIVRGAKLQSLMTFFPKGTALTAEFLREQGFNAQLIARYKRSRWLEPLGNGAYRRQGDNINWQGGLAALQQQLKLDIHCGARTALEYQGYGHYVALSARTVYLFGPPGQKLPKWFQDHEWNVKVTYRMTSLFPSVGLEQSYLDFPANDFTIRMSSPERAAMEMLCLVPFEQSFDEAERIMEALLTLRPALVQRLLETCNSIKVKRVFMFMAEKFGLPWVEQLDLGKTDFGKGDRTVVEGGRLDPKYKITVPRSETAKQVEHGGNWKR